MQVQSSGHFFIYFNNSNRKKSDFGGFWNSLSRKIKMDAFDGESE